MHPSSSYHVQSFNVNSFVSSMTYMAAPAPQYMMPTHGGYAHAPHPQAPAHAPAQAHATHVYHGHGQIPGSVHLVSTGPIRTEVPQRKRPKYTRSKTGCLTCRGKKIKVLLWSRPLPRHFSQFFLKCDETKPNCTRCTNCQRDVSTKPKTWNGTRADFNSVHLARASSCKEAEESTLENINYGDGGQHC